MEKKDKDEIRIPKKKMTEENHQGKRLNTLWIAVILTLLIGASLLAAYIVNNDDAFEDYKTYKVMDQFDSSDQLNFYLRDRTTCYDYYLYGGPIYTMGTPELRTGAMGDPGSTQMAIDYSRTNIQVEGVDEADIVKTDGQYLYVVSDMNVTVLRAYPVGTAEVLSRIEFDNRPIEMFLNDDRLMVFENVYVLDSETYCSYNPYATIKIYDVSSPSNPQLVRNITTDGYYFNSRMIGDHAYVVLTHYINYMYNEAELPVIRDNGVSIAIAPTDINYFKPRSEYYMLTMVLSVNIKDDNTPNYEIYLTDYAQEMYASLGNIYLTNHDYESYSGNGWTRWTEKTWIHKIAIDAGEMNYQGSVRVPGWVLNQFSMDEYDGYFRIATTATTGASRWNNGDSDNRVYVLDEDLDLVGKLEGLAEGERIYSARFMGERCYLVTFRQVDPFFVIDLSNPESPEVLGELKIPGYSDYLHPYDDDHVIGLGMEDNHLKLSFFDVTDVRNPAEISKYTIVGDNEYSYSSSNALYDHKAFLFSRSKDLLVIPVSVDSFDYDRNYTNYSFWQGAYVFSLTLENGFELKGTVTHIEESSGGDPYSYYYRYDVRRSLYIENGLYTISEKLVKINNLDTMNELKEIEL